MIDTVKKLSIQLAVVISVLFVHDYPAIGQVQWSPPDKSFSIEVPVILTQELDGYGEASDPNAVKTYVAEIEGYNFLLLVLKYKKYTSMKTEDKFGGLFFTIGGDDDHDFIERNIKIDGLAAQEIVYKKQLEKKGLFIDAGDMVVVLGLFVRDKNDLKSDVAKRFFGSFKLNRTLRNQSKKH